MFCFFGKKKDNLYIFLLNSYAVTDNAFRSLIEENKGQCVLISGKYLRLLTDIYVCMYLQRSTYICFRKN